MYETFKYYVVPLRKILWKGTLLICLNWTTKLDNWTILIKYVFSPSSAFINDFDISFWRFFISDFKIIFSIRCDWIITLILLRDVIKIGAYGFEGVGNEFAFHFIDLLLLCNSFFFVYNPYWLKFFSVHSFDQIKTDSCKGSLFSWNGINTFGMECFISKE